MSTDPQHLIPLVILATAWGPKFGGINAFNEELTYSLGVKADRTYELICVVPRATETEVAEAAASCHVRLLVLGDVTKDGELPAELAAHVLQALNLSAQQQSSAVWVGHDDKTGPLAVALRDLCVGSKAVLVHHMAFGAYQDFKKSDSQVANDKREMQRALFKQADLCLAVGPMLQEQLNDLLRTVPKAPPVEMLVPGLAEPDPDHVQLTDDSPSNFTAFLGGRLGSDDERIKQALLGVRGIGHAVGQAFSDANHHHALRKSPTLRMRGVPDDQHTDVRDACTQSASGQNVNFDLQPYTHDRSAYFTALASSSVAMMPSWHEGFGLTAWEAIACRVPVVIGEQSGVYRLLDDRCQGAGLGKSVRPINVQGRLPETASEAPHTDADVAAVGTAIHAIGDHLIETKANAVQLAQNLRNDHGFTWTKCAADAVAAMQTHLQISLTREPVVSPNVATPPPEDAAAPNAVPAWLRVPQPRRSQTELGASPSALLVARDRVVRFDAVRDPLLLNEWLQHLHDPARKQITVRLVSGAGGTGKTRSALELLDRAQQAEPSQTQAWTPLWMPAEVGPAQLTQWREFLQTQTAPCLLVVDYAEGRQGAVLQWLQVAYELASDALSVNPKLQLHLLCLARTAAWWHELPRSSDCTQDVANLLTGPANLGAMSMPEWPADVQARTATFQAALQDYAAAQGMNTPSNAWQPQLDQAPYERPLYIHLAALAALAGERPAHAQALLGAQLKREFEHLCRAEKSLGNTPPRYADWANVMAWLALAQGAQGADLEGALVALKNESAGLGKAIQRACEVESETGASCLAALEPDLLAEAVIVEQVAGRQGAVILDLAFTHGSEGGAQFVAAVFEVVVRLGLRSDLGDFVVAESQPRWVVQMLAALARAWRQQGQLMVAFAHARGHNFGQWLLPSWQLLSPQAQRDTAAQLTLPRYSSVLLGLAVSVTEANLRAAVTDPARASALNNLSCRLSDQNTVIANARSLSIARQSVYLYRRLAKKSPSTYLPDLAGTLSNLAERLSKRHESSSRAEALRLANEALLIFRKLAANQRPEFRPNIARTLQNLANVLSRQGGDSALSAALIAVTESVAIYRALEADSPSKYLPDLAMSLNNLASRLSEQSPPAQGAAALDAASESVEIRTRLAQKRRFEYLPNLALSLNTFANCLFDFGEAAERSKALDTARSAVAIYARLHSQMPSAFERNFGIASQTLLRIADKQGLDGQAELQRVIDGLRGAAK
jgi:hypothetical protein